jgi:nitroreductase
MPAAIENISRYGSIFPAVQNLLLAARGYGLGAAMTALHRIHEADVKAVLGIPEEAETFCLIAMGYPDRPFGPVDRLPVGDVTYYDGWGRTAP